MTALDDEMSCTHEDGHCLHWYDAEACCRCGAPAMTNEQLVEYGADPIIGPGCINQGIGLPERPCGFCHEGPCPNYGTFGDARGYRRHLAAALTAERRER